MSVHRSLAKKGLGAVHRNVFNRYERLKKLEESGKRKEGDRVIGLPKIRSIKIK